ncbi:Chorismate mutase AroH [Polystyrenella longa]|uniref:chorismate mutase n=1 Tax=Polystyrenella longa TaxID=2528007 RepID=A0A518CKR3_9PLAN|nr:chorismate mutase [Polystyrenella longa]QDU79812.1 Chorismate mutase AroH [Polystyrenella longa]
MAVRGIRGATSVETDSSEEILAATSELLQAILQANGIDSLEEISSAFFTTTSDLTSAFPAEAARKLGWSQVPLLCATEIPVPGGLPRGIRILLHLNTDKTQAEMEHVYLREAKRLRPDIHSAQ